MNSQVEWDISKVKLFNLNHSELIIQDKVCKKAIKIASSKPTIQSKVVDSSSFIKEINDEKIQEFKESIDSIVENPPEPVAEEPNPVMDLLERKGKRYFCAPVIGKKLVVDELYGSSYNTFQYGDKITIDIIVVDENDLQIQFWSLVNLQENSIIYRKNKGERWWRVQKTEEKSGGFLSTAIVSDVNPDFS